MVFVNGLEMQRPKRAFSSEMEKWPFSQRLRTAAYRVGVEPTWTSHRPTGPSAVKESGQPPSMPHPSHINAVAGSLPSPPLQTVTTGLWMPPSCHPQPVPFPCPAPATNLSEMEDPTLLLGRDCWGLSSPLTGPQQQAAPGVGSSRGGAAAAGEWSHRAGCIRKSPRPG